MNTTPITRSIGYTRKPELISRAGYARADRTLAPAGLQRLDREDFHMVLHCAAIDDTLPGALEKETTRRMQNDELDHADFFALLILTLDKKQSGWARLREQSIDYLEQHLDTAICTLYIGSESGVWTRPRFDTAPTDKGFKSTVTIRSGIEPFTSHECTAPNKKLAEKIAAISLLSLIVGIDRGSLCYE